MIKDAFNIGINSENFQHVRVRRSEKIQNGLWSRFQTHPSNTHTLLDFDLCSILTIKSFTFLAFAILESAFAATTAQCNADNCLSAMTNTLSVASSMCNTYIASTIVTTITPTVTVSFTNTILPTPPATIPGKATSVPIDARISSACSCISVSPTTVTSTALAAAVTTIIDPPTPCDLSDIQGDGGTYTINDITYNVQCNMDPNADCPMALASVSDLGSCIAACSTTSGCIGVYWDPTGGWGSTYYGLLSDLWGLPIALSGSYVAYLPSYDIQNY